MTNPSLLDPALSILPSRYRPYAVKVVAGLVVLCAVVLISINVIGNAKEKRLRQINEYYWDMSVAIDDGETEKALESFNQILVQGNETQMLLSSMLMAYGHFKDESYVEAQGLYSQVIEKAEVTSLRDTARIRLAKVFIALDRYEEASTTINEVETATLFFQIIAESILGDINLLQQDFDDAGYSYFKAHELASQLDDQNMINSLQDKRDMLNSLRLQLGLPPTDLVPVSNSGGATAP